jgi:hypothetical protein
VRLSILWKGYAFWNEREQAIFDDHRADLSLDIILDVVAQDLRARGIDRPPSPDPLQDKTLRNLLLTTYPAAAERYCEDAARPPVPYPGSPTP